jgi:hypothetical protein
LYWTPGSDAAAAGCEVKYRKAGDAAWKDGLALWYDARDGECRGSLVHLSPGSAYEVRLKTRDGKQSELKASTWPEDFPVARIVTLPAGTSTQPLAITQGGSASGYVLYQANPAGTTIDVQNAHPELQRRLPRRRAGHGRARGRHFPYEIRAAVSRVGPQVVGERRSLVQTNRGLSLCVHRRVSQTKQELVTARTTHR